MGLGIVSDDLFEKELNKSINKGPIPPSITGEVVDKPVRGRKEGDNGVPDSLRKIIGEESEINGRQSALSLASQFGLSPSSVSAYANGSTSTKTYNKRPNLSHISEAKVRVQNHARAKLTKALNFLDSDKLKSAKAVDLSTIAKNMSSIIRNMEPEVSPSGLNINGDGAVIQHIFYAPNVKREDQYEVITVNE